MNENEEMLELQREIGGAGAQIKVLSEQICAYCDISPDVHEMLIIIKEKSSFIKESSSKLARYLEFKALH